MPTSCHGLEQAGGEGYIRWFWSAGGFPLGALVGVTGQPVPVSVTCVYLPQFLGHMPCRPDGQLDEAGHGLRVRYITPE